MNAKDQKLCEAILSPGKEMSRRAWVVVMRQGSLLLALPQQRKLALASIQLYQPQKWKGRLFRFALKILVKLGLHRLLPKLELPIGDRGLFAGLDKLTSRGEMGFLLSNPESKFRNVIGLYEIDGELCVVKAGCGDAAKVVRREFGSMQEFESSVPGVPSCRAIFDIENGAVYVAEWVQGDSPHGTDDDRSVFLLLDRWLDLGTSMKISDLDCWQRLRSTLNEESYAKIRSLEGLEALCPVMHGDFTPWNIKMTCQGEVKVLDWEFADSSGLAGWDGLHYHVQRLSLVEEDAPNQIIQRCRQYLASDQMQEYLKRAGLIGQEELILGSYLYYSGYVNDYPRKKLISLWEDSGSSSSVASDVSRA